MVRVAGGEPRGPPVRVRHRGCGEAGSCGTIQIECATATPSQQAPGTTAQSGLKEAKLGAENAKQDPDRTLICESIPDELNCTPVRYVL